MGIAIAEARWGGDGRVDAAALERLARRRRVRGRRGVAQLPRRRRGPAGAREGDRGRGRARGARGGRGDVARAARPRRPLRRRHRVRRGAGVRPPAAFGGPLLGFFAARQSHLRQMPGRLVGETVDSAGRRGYVLTLSTREQHIRREKATSNICTNHGLMALAATIVLSLLGKQGVRELALASHAKAEYVKAGSWRRAQGAARGSRSPTPDLQRVSRAARRPGRTPRASEGRGDPGRGVDHPLRRRLAEGASWWRHRARTPGRSSTASSTRCRRLA